MQLPCLGRVPSIHQSHLSFKVTQTGVTLLTKSKYRSRYTGSKNCAVDINGNLHLKSSEAKKLAESPDKKKRLAVQANRTKCNVHEPQISDNLSTQTNDLSPLETRLSTQRGYKINKREVRQRLLGYINTQRGKKELYFWTVTFFAGTSDDLCYKIFNIWLTSLRKYKMLREYLWIAERQDGKRAPHKAPTNTLHFHIAIPHRMDVHRANRMMAGTLKTFARRGELPATVHQCSRYNGVDISKNRNTKRVINFAIKKGSRALSNYLTKYVTKNDVEFSHLAWHNSRGYSQLFTGVTFTLEEFKKFAFGFFLDRRRVFEIGDFAKFIPWIRDPPPLVEDHLYKLNSFIQLNKN
jgi:hypothetical protein